MTTALANAPVGLVPQLPGNTPPGSGQYLTFTLQNEVYGLDILRVREILEYTRPTTVPMMPAFVHGVINLRGNVVPVIDLGRFLFGTRTQPSERTRLLVVRQSGGSVALMVDEVFGQRTVDEQQRREAEPEDDPRLARFVDDRVGEQKLALFSMGKLVRAPDFRQAAA